MDRSYYLDQDRSIYIIFERHSNEKQYDQRNPFKESNQSEAANIII